MARWEQLFLSSVATLIFVLSFIDPPHPTLTLTPAFARAALAAFAVLVGGLACSPGSERALQAGAACFTVVVGLHMFKAGLAVRGGVAIEGLTLAAGAFSAALAAPAKPVPVKTTRQSL